jgi:hypothetical protein
MNRVVLGAGFLAISAASAGAAELRPETIAAWNRYVAKAETALQRTRAIEPQGGRHVDVPGGTIYHWRGSTIVRGTTVDRVVHRLMYPGTPPPQEDVLESRVLSRRGDSLHVYLKLARTVLVTVTYDTEHDVTFQRVAPGVMTSRSVSTRIVESGGSDRGFLWRLNSYWRYTQVGTDVLIELESLSLSRDVPRLARPIAVPIANRIARESVARTLASVRAFLEP